MIRKSKWATKLQLLTINICNTMEAGDISQMPLFNGLQADTLRYAGNVKRTVAGLEEFVLSLVHDGSGQTVVHPESEVLLHRQDFDLVKLSVGHQFVAEHRRHLIYGLRE